LKKNAQENDVIEQGQASPRGFRIRRLVVFMLCILMVLALWPWGSYDPRDAEFLAGGISHGPFPQNWIGYIGAYFSYGALLLLGYGAYCAVFAFLICSGRRLFGRRGLRDVKWDYWVALVLLVIGAAMLFGIWPGLWTDFSERLNIAMTPGGVIGQRLCAPDSGWMRFIMHSTGSAIVALTLIAGSVAVIWLHDWHDWFMRFAAAGREAAGDEKKQPAAAKAKNALAARREARLKRRKERERELAQTEVEREPQTVTESKTGKNGDNGAKKDKKAPAKPPAATAKNTAKGAYTLPGLDLLDDVDAGETAAEGEEIERKKDILQGTLDSFGIDAQVTNAISGPRVTLFEVVPAPGVKVERISNLSNNIRMDLSATSVRILTPIPGKKSVGIEVPNAEAAMVPLRGLLTTKSWKNTKAKIPLLLGRGISGNTVILDLTKAPHLLIAGATGSGKSVCVNLLIMSLLYRFTPEELRLIMVDPKVVEFQVYNSLPHLIVPVITDVKRVPLALRWAINEMQRRYKVLAKVGARNLENFNARPKSKEVVLDDEGNAIPDTLPYIVVIIDELADIMMTAKADVETSLARLAQLSRAVGIHTVIATQRPDVKVITGTIKANFPCRIAFQVSSQVDSRTIIDGKGAEALLGRGDMLFRPPGASGLERNQGGMVSDEERDRVIEFVSEQAEPDYDEDVFKTAGGDGDTGGGAPGVGGETSDEDEALVQQAIEVILRDRRATTSYIQRCLRIGYNRAAMIIDILEQRGIIGPQVGTNPREILILSDAGDDLDDDDDDNEVDTDNEDLDEDDDGSA
jgi:S-DNA-T family DNA segregation ATPase FtsK/SpoIIIE